MNNRPFWRETQLTEPEAALLNATLRAHSRCVDRNNISSHVLENVAMGSGNYCNALASAILSIGHSHAPLEQTMELLSNQCPATVELKMPVPGYGNSFVKGEADPIWGEVDHLLRVHFMEIHNRIWIICERLKSKGIFPNPSAYTAATAIALGIPPCVAAWIFISGRLGEWSKLFLRHG